MSTYLCPWISIDLKKKKNLAEVLGAPEYLKSNAKSGRRNQLLA